MRKCILINILLILLLFGIVEIYSFIKTNNENIILKQNADKLADNGTTKFKTSYVPMQPFNPTVWRNSFLKENSDKLPIIWFGCSYAEGAGLEDEHTPCRKISQLTSRSCINRSKGATGTQFMYYQLINPEFTDSAPRADYVIYVFIYNHLQRLYNFQVNPFINMFNLRYEIKNDKLTEIKPVLKPFYSLFSVKRILNKIAGDKTAKEQKDFRLFNKIMQESVKTVNQIYKKDKPEFILLEFPDKSNKELPKEEIKQLEEFGITVVKVTDLTSDIDIYDKKYWAADEIHPSEKLWDIILPRFVNLHLSE